MKKFHVADDIVIAIGEIADDSVLNDGTEPMTARQKEKKTVSCMLQSLLGTDTLDHNEAGKPFIEGFNISISHTVSKHGGYAAIMLSKNHSVGIDIEYKSQRIMKIASRFLRDDEKPVTVDDHLVYWCAKEAVYKLFSEDDLTYQQMRVNQQMTEVGNLKRGETVRIFSEVNDNFVLVYTYI